MQNPANAMDAARPTIIAAVLKSNDQFNRKLMLATNKKLTASH
jgi:hypothetical protein